jgi:chromosome segregation ATPase
MHTGGDAGRRGVAARRLLALTLTVAVAVLAAGCGDDTSSPEEWANGVCSAFSDWRAAVTTAGEELRSGATTKEDLEGAVDDLEEATDEFVDDIRGLDELDTENGRKAKEALDQLADDIDQNKEDIQETVSGASGVQELVQAATAVGSTISQMGQQLQQTFRELEQLDPGSELSDAFENAEACQSLSG